MKVLFVSPEVGPIIRAGGLGDVVGALPIALHEMGVDIRILCPFHRACVTLKTNSLNTPINLGLGSRYSNSQIEETRLGDTNIPVYLIKNDLLFDRIGIYADENGDYHDNPIRCFALCKAALLIEKVTSWKPDIFHSHDWMAASLPAYLNAEAKSLPRNRKSRSVLTIHNLEHQGSYPSETFSLSGLPLSFSGIEGFSHFNSMNLLKGGIQHADKITTVSPTYAGEIRTEEYGHGLEKCLKYRGADLVGILNGIDENSWNPQTDGSLNAKILPSTPKEGKYKNKKALLKEMNLPADSKNPVFGAVSRLYHQKGLDLLADVIPDLIAKTKAQFVILGSGEKKQESKFLKLSKQFPKNVSSFIGFDDSLARRIFAGSDFFLMPSRFEPCGLAQQYAMKYGSIPIARKTGGLADTIIDFNENQDISNGFLFEKSSKTDLIKVIHKAIELYKTPELFKKVRQAGLDSQFSWDLAAKKYIDVYNWAFENN